MIVDDHVTTNLSGIEAIVPYFQQADNLIGDDMENEDIQRMITCINQPLLDSPIVFINPAAEVIGHEKTEDGRDGKGEKLLEGRAPVHVGCEILREKVYHSCKEQGCPESGMTAHDLCTVGSYELSENKANAKEKAAHHLAVASLYDINDLQTFPGLPATEQEHEYADQARG